VTKRQETLEKLAEEADVERQPVRVLTRLATNLTASDHAVAFAKQICRRHPDDVLANLTLADICLSRIEPPQLEEAVRYYTAAIALCPDHADPYLNLGNALKDQGKIDEAIAEYREAVRRQPDSPQGYNNLAWLLATSGDRKWRQPADAVAMAMKAVELAPKKSIYWGTLGAARYAKGQFDEAIAAFGKAFELGSGGAASEWLLRAMAHWQLGQNDEARKWYEQSVAWMKDNKPDKEFTRFRAEADALLGIAAEKPPTKDATPPPAAKGGAPANP
jgi:tetratricopeptide (TPR) repeat protein